MRKPNERRTSQMRLPWAGTASLTSDSTNGEQTFSITTTGNGGSGGDNISGLQSTGGAGGIGTASSTLTGTASTILSSAATGVGGAGGNSLDMIGGAGGAGSATADAESNGSGEANTSATASGGAGGAGNELVTGGSGGLGGGASAISTTSTVTAATAATSAATGGGGGNADGAGELGGSDNTGSAVAMARSSSGSAVASATAIGGAGGIGKNGATGGPGGFAEATATSVTSTGIARATATATGGDGSSGGGSEAIATATVGALELQQIDSESGQTTAQASVISSPNLSSGTFSVTNVSIGTVAVTGSSTQSGTAVLNASNSVIVNSNSTYNLAGGALTTPSLIVNGKFIYSGGNLSIGSLCIATSGGVPVGTLDLTDNHLVISAGSNPSQLATISSLTASGYAGGLWTGTGITSSTAAGDSTHLTAVGVIINDDGTGTGTPLYSSFGGTPTKDEDILLKYTYYGDANLDGKVDGTDYSRIDNAFLTDQSAPGTLSDWYNGDFNYDGVIDGSDYTLIDNAFNSQGAQISDQFSAPNAIATAEVSSLSGIASVPEPALASLLSIAVLGLLGRPSMKRSGRIPI